MKVTLSCFYCGGEHMSHKCTKNYLFCGLCGKREGLPFSVGDTCVCGGKFIGDRTLTNITCECGGTSVVLTGFGGYQEADPGRGMPMIEGQEVTCNDCGRSWWE